MPLRSERDKHPTQKDSRVTPEDELGQLGVDMQGASIADQYRVSPESRAERLNLLFEKLRILFLSSVTKHAEAGRGGANYIGVLNNGEKGRNLVAKFLKKMLTVDIDTDDAVDQPGPKQLLEQLVAELEEAGGIKDVDLLFRLLQADDIMTFLLADDEVLADQEILFKIISQYSDLYCFLGEINRQNFDLFLAALRAPKPLWPRIEQLRFFCQPSVISEVQMQELLEQIDVIDPMMTLDLPNEMLVRSPRRLVLALNNLIYESNVNNFKYERIVELLALAEQHGVSISRIMRIENLQLHMIITMEESAIMQLLNISERFEFPTSVDLLKLVKKGYRSVLERIDEVFSKMLATNPGYMKSLWYLQSEQWQDHLPKTRTLYFDLVQAESARKTREQNELNGSLADEFLS